MAARLQPDAEPPDLVRELFPGVPSYPDTLNNAEPRFPGFPVAGGQNSNRWNWNIQARSTIGKNLVNQFVTGYTASHVYFFTEITPDVFTGVPVGDQAGFSLNIGAFATTNNNDITTPTASTAPQQRTNPTIDVSDTLTWLKGSHSFSLGGSFTHIGLWAYNQTVVPTVKFGIATGDPADAMFTHDELPERLEHEPGRRAGAVFRADGTHDSINGECASEREHRQVRVSRARCPARPAARVRGLHPGLVACAQEPDPQLRPAVRTAVAVRLAQQQLRDRDGRGHLRASRRDRTAATCSSRARCRARSRSIRT